MGRPINSDSVRDGRNAEYPALDDRKYVRCSRCDYICHLDRDDRGSTESRMGWGLNYIDQDIVSATYDDSRYSYQFGGDIRSVTYGGNAYVKLNLPMNGTNGSTSFTDNSMVPIAVTARGNAQISTAQKKFGTASGLFSTSADYITFPDSSSFQVGSGAFGVDCQVNLTVSGSTNAIFGDYESSGTNKSLFLAINTTGFPVFQCTFSNLTTGAITHQSSISNNTWAHLAVVSDGTNLYLYNNGVQSSTSISIGGKAIHSAYTTNWTIGRGGDYVGISAAGYIDQFRWTTGLAPWTGPFDAPTSEYQEIVTSANSVYGTKAMGYNDLISYDFEGSTYIGNDDSLAYDGVIRTISDPIKNGGCPQCGTYLYNK